MPATPGVANLGVNINVTGAPASAAAINSVTQSLAPIQPAAVNAGAALANAVNQLNVVTPAAGRATAGLSRLNTGLGPTVNAFNQMTSAAGSAAAVLGGANFVGNTSTGLPALPVLTQRAGKSLNDLKGQLQRFKDALGNATSTEQINRLNAAIQATQTRISAITRLPPIIPPTTVPVLNNLRNSSQSASVALTNLGRVAQDAPFGFIGIANNLNPLLESFQRLRVESGSNRAALSALGTSLMGAGGIGLALSAVTAIVSFAQMGFRAWGASTKGAGGAIDELAEKTKKFTEIDKEANNQIAKDVVNLKVLAKLATDAAAPYEARKKAVDELQKLYPAYLGNLKDEQILNGNAAAAIDTVTKALYNKAYAEAASSKAAQVLGSLLELRAKENKLVTQRNELIAKVDPREVKVYGEAARTFPILNKQIEDVRSQFGAINKEAQFFIDEAEKFKSISIDLDPKIKEAKPKAEKIVKELREAVRKSFDEAPLIMVTDAVPIINAAIKFDKKESAKDIDEQVKFFREGFKAPQNIVSVGLTFEIGKQLGDANKRFVELKSNIDQAASGLFAFSNGSSLNGLDKITLQALLAQRAFESLATSFRQTLITSINDGLATVGEAIGNLVSGKSSGLEAFFNIISDAAKSLGKALIAFGTAKIVLDKFANIKGPIAIAAGIGLIALGQILKNAVPKFAEGGIVSGPTTAMIGEAGQSEVVMPLSRLSGMLSSRGGGLGGLVEFEISGNNLHGVLSKTQGSRRRTY